MSSRLAINNILPTTNNTLTASDADKATDLLTPLIIWVSIVCSILMVTLILLANLRDYLYRREQPNSEMCQYPRRRHPEVGGIRHSHAVWHGGPHGGHGVMHSGNHSGTHGGRHGGAHGGMHEEMHGTRGGHHSRNGRTDGGAHWSHRGHHGEAHPSRNVPHSHSHPQPPVPVPPAAPEGPISPALRTTLALIEQQFLASRRSASDLGEKWSPPPPPYKAIPAC